MEDERKALSKAVKDLRGKKAQAISENKVFKKNRKQLDDSNYTFVDKSYIKNAIIRAAYHGRDLNGGGIIILVDKAHDIMTEIKAHLIQRAKDNRRCSYKEEDANNICYDDELIVILWDGALSEV